MIARRGKVLKTAVVYLFVIWCVAPILWLISTSLKSDVDAFSATPVWFFVPEFGSYLEAWGDGGMSRAVLLSTLVAVVSSAIGIVAGLPLAYLTTHVWPSRSPLSGRIMVTVLLLTTIPPALSLVPFYRAFFRIGFTSNVRAVLVVHSFYATLLAVLILRSFLLGFPREIREAALIDGAGEWRTLAYCFAPNMWGAMFAVFVLALIQSWNEYFFALVLTSGTSETVPVAISGFLSYYGTNWAQLTAAGVIGTLPIVFFAIAVRRHMARGLTFGGVQ